MRKIILITLLLFALAACSNEGDDGNTNGNGSENNNKGSNQEIGSAGSSEAPRLEEAPAATPTATLPAAALIPTRSNPDHVFAVTTRIVHIVEAGDTMTHIANRYEITVKTLADANRLYNFDLIEVGDTLYIPPCVIEDGLSHIQDGDR